jgi:hypothetical protein
MRNFLYHALGRLQMWCMHFELFVSKPHLTHGNAKHTGMNFYASSKRTSDRFHVFSPEHAECFLPFSLAFQAVALQPTGLVVRNDVFNSVFSPSYLDLQQVIIYASQTVSSNTSRGVPGLPRRSFLS